MPAPFVVVVDDDPDFRQAAALAFEDLGFTVYSASNGSEALKYLEREENSVDLLFTDIQMPGMDGRELARAAMAIKPKLAVILTSGVVPAVAGAGIPFIRKPFDFPQLAAVVQSVCAP